MPLLVWFCVENISLLFSAEKPQVPTTVRGVKRKLPGTLFVSPLAINKFWWSLGNLTANFAPDGFLRSNDIKVRRSDTIFYRELQNCEKSLVKSKSSKNNAEDFPCKKFVVLLFVKIIFYFLMDFFIPKKSTILKSTISKVIYLLLQAFTTAENLFKM